MTAAERSEVGVDALELYVEVLSQSEDASGDVFYDRLCDAVCRLAHMRRALIFRYDSARRRVRAAGAHGLSLEPFDNAHVTVESAPIAAQSLQRGSRDRDRRRHDRAGARASTRTCSPSPSAWSARRWRRPGAPWA